MNGRGRGCVPQRLPPIGCGSVFPGDVRRCRPRLPSIAVPPRARIVIGAAVAGVVLGAAALSFLAATRPAVVTTAQNQGSSRPVGAIYRQIPREGSAGRIGAPAPVFAWATPEGALTDLEALRGRVVVMNFWATWCLSCRREMPVLDRVAARRPEVSFLAVNLQEDAGAVGAFFDELRLSRLQPVIDPTGETTRRYGVLTLGTTFFIDATGIVRRIEVAGPGSEETIERDIAQAEAAAFGGSP